MNLKRGSSLVVNSCESFSQSSMELSSFGTQTYRKDNSENNYNQFNISHRLACPYIHVNMNNQTGYVTIFISIQHREWSYCHSRLLQEVNIRVEPQHTEKSLPKQTEV